MTHGVLLLLYIAGSFYSYNCNCYRCRVDYAVGRVCVFVYLSTGHKVHTEEKCIENG